MAFRLLFILSIWIVLLNAHDFAHPKRFEAIKQALLAQGIAQSRIDEIFNSKLFVPHDTKAVRAISDISSIKRHRKAEKRANENILLKRHLIQKHLKRYKNIYDKVEQEFDINREIVAAILQKETALGAYKAYKHNALTVFVSMLDTLKMPKNPTYRMKKRYKRLLNFAQRNLIALIVHFEKRGEDVLTADLRASYAGAMGIPQFTPQHLDMIKAPSLKDPKNLHHMPTAIYSTAHLLSKRFGWSKRIDFSRIHITRISKLWRAFDDGQANFVYEKNLDGIKVPRLVDTYSNDEQVAYIASYIKILKRYNFSTEYALGILHIAKASHTPQS